MSELDLESLSSELTGTTGLDNHPDDDTPVPNSIADQVEEFESHAADKAQRIADVEDGIDTDQADYDDVGAEAKRGGKQQVPLAALQEERRRRQEIQQQFAAQQQQYQQMQQQLAQFQQMQQQAAQGQAQQQQAIEIPEFNEDPEGHVRALTEQFKAELQNVQYQAQAQQQEVQARQQLAQVGQEVTRLEADFAARPDVGVEAYRQAHEIVHGDVIAHLQQMYPGATPEQFQWAQQQASLQFIKWCATNQRNPAEHVWQRAQALGFTPGQRVAATQQGGHQTPGYAIIDRPRQVAPNTSLGSLAGAHGPDETGKLTAERVNNMTDSEFEKLCKDMRRSSNPSVFGG